MNLKIVAINAAANRLECERKNLASYLNEWPGDDHVDARAKMQTAIDAVGRLVDSLRAYAAELAAK